MNIYFNEPINFNLEIIEIDEILPSMHVEVKISIKRFLYSTNYCGKFWLNCSTWDSFNKELNNLLNMNAMLHDMSNHFLLNIYNENENTFLRCNFYKSHSNESIAISYNSKINKDVFSIIQKQFNDFPIWW